MTFLDAAESVLRGTKEPMHVAAITRKALEGGVLKTDGQTPVASMGAVLAVHVKKQGESSRFVRTAPSTYGLREWLGSGKIAASVADRGDRKAVRVPHFPLYSEVRALIPILSGVAVKTLTGMQTAIHAQSGNPRATKDWSDPAKWIPDCLTGDHADLAGRIWAESQGTVNPRHMVGHALLLRRYGLLRAEAGGRLVMTPEGKTFLDESGTDVELQIDEDEGLLKILSLVAELGPARRGVLLDPWRAYLADVGTARADSYVAGTLYKRLRNLVAREHVAREGQSYVVTDSGLQWLDSRKHGSEPCDVDLYQQILNLSRQHKTQVQDAILDVLREMDPYEFEGLIAQLLECMGYEDCEVTPRGGDKGIDVVATYGVGITSIRVVVQAKRQPGNVGRPVLDGLRGSLHRFQADRGTIITIGGFSRGTREAATEVGVTPITLIDGLQLVKLLTENGIGIRKKSIEIWELDPSAFSGEGEPDA